MVAILIWFCDVSSRLLKTTAVISRLLASRARGKCQVETSRDKQVITTKTINHSVQSNCCGDELVEEEDSRQDGLFLIDRTAIGSFVREEEGLHGRLVPR